MNAYSLPHRVVNRIKLPFRKEKEFFLSLHKVLGFFPRRASFYRQALLHKSAQRKVKGKHLDNERLEFLGDAILDAVVGDIVFRRFPGKREGFLTNARSKIVQRSSLGSIAKQIGLDKLIVKDGENSSHNSYLAGNAFEALVGAIYIDWGYSTCKAFLEKRILRQLVDVEKVAYKEVNFKSKLLEWCQKRHYHLEFVVLSQEKDSHNSPVFTTCAVIEGVRSESGSGYSKKESQQQAARNMLNKIYHESGFVQKLSENARQRRQSAEPNDTPPEE